MDEFERLVRVLKGLGIVPPSDFLSGYQTLRDLVYFGGNPRPVEDRPIRRGKKIQADFWFGDWKLLGAKTEVDRAIGRVLSELLRWVQARERAAVPRSGQGDTDDRECPGN